MWVERDTYFEHTAPQRSDEWKEARVARPTASTFLDATGKGFNSPIEYARLLAGIDEPDITPLSRLRMDEGTRKEPFARQYYIDTRNVEIEEIGLAVPKWDTRIGASTDGIVVGTEGIIEIKCPFHLYPPILEYMSKIESGWKPPEGYHKHIKESHYAQMQGTMAILNKKWCDYIVYCDLDDQVFIYRVNFDEEYWKDLHKKLDSFITVMLNPLLVNTKYPIMPKDNKPNLRKKTNDLPSCNADKANRETSQDQKESQTPT